jgi:glycosyltransferase involved in cell wall biosynthesis
LQTTEELVQGSLQQAKNQIGVLIPCYNEENRIASVIIGCQEFASKIYVCDDGSSDLTAQIARKMGATVIQHKQNLGYGAALRTLFDAASDSNLRIVVTFDGDGQHDPKYIEQLTKPILNGESDIVIGSRFSEKENEQNVPGYRKAGIKVITAATNLANSLNVKDSQSGLRAYDVRFLRKIMPSEMDMSASTEILMKASSERLRIKEIPVRIKYNEDSSTHNPLIHGGSLLLGVFKQYSLKHPLLFYGSIGVGSLFVSLVFWILLIASYSSTKLIETNFAILSIGLTIIGFMFATTSIILWTVTNVVRSVAR